jgi:hypothetical protein
MGFFYIPHFKKFYTNVIYKICQYFINLIPNAFGSKCRPVPSFRYGIKQIVQ